MPPRSASAATHFTSTTPHASVRSPPSATAAMNKASARQQLHRNPGPGGETPQQKVARLRAAAAKARDVDVSGFDRLVMRGRVWADRAHRFTALSLIGITGICGVVTVYALGDMMIYNRRKRAEYFTQQKAQHAAAVYEADEARIQNRASEEQLQLLLEEARATAAEEARKAAQANGIFARSKKWLFSGLQKEEEGENFGTSERRLGYESSNEEDDYLGERESDILRAIEEKKAEVAAKAKAALEREQDLHKTGGPLDRVGTADSDTKKSGTGGGWFAFLGRK